MARRQSRSSTRARTVAITGASSGLGRATALEFARRGWNVALIARGARGLDAAAAEVTASGGRPLVLPLDVADARAVESAADRIVREFGGLDVWINGAAVSEYAPLQDIAPEDFRRITEVNYLGSVNGLRAALRHMRPRNRGHIVQVGSVVSQRAVPLQSAYSGAKYAIRGVLDSLNTELRHERSRIRTTIVQPPGMNTPFFDHARNRLPRRPMPTPPVYEPEVTARAIWRASDDGGRIHGRFGAHSLDEGQVVDPARVRWMLGMAALAAVGATIAGAAIARRRRRIEADDYGVSFGVASRAERGDASLESTSRAGTAPARDDGPGVNPRARPAPPPAPPARPDAH